MNVAGDEQVDVAVAVVVTPGRAGAEAPAANPCFFRNVFEFAAAEVAVERVAAVSGDEEVELAVVVIVGDGDAHTPAEAREAGLLGDVLERAAGLLMIERDQGIAAFEVAFDGGAVDQDDVQTAVVIAIEQAGPAADGFNDVALISGGDVRDGKAERFGDIREFWDRRKAGAVNS